MVTRALVYGMVCIFLFAAVGDAAEKKATKTKPMPIGSLDQPKDGTVSGATPTWGWALEQGGKVTAAELLLDGKSFQKLRLDADRPDVCAKYQVPGCPKVGFKTTADFSKVKKGKHTLALQITDAFKSKVKIGEREIVVE